MAGCVDDINPYLIAPHVPRRDIASAFSKSYLLLYSLAVHHVPSTGKERNTKRPLTFPGFFRFFLSRSSTMPANLLVDCRLGSMS